MGSRDMHDAKIKIVIFILVPNNLHGTQTSNKFRILNSHYIGVYDIAMISICSGVLERIYMV